MTAQPIRLHPETVAEAKEHYSDGMNVECIARYLGIPKTVLRYHLVKGAKAKHNALTNRWKKEHPEQLALINKRANKKYYGTHRELIHKRQLSYYLKNRAKVLARNRVYFLAHKEEIMAKRKARYRASLT